MEHAVLTQTATMAQDQDREMVLDLYVFVLQITPGINVTYTSILAHQILVRTMVHVRMVLWARIHVSVNLDILALDVVLSLMIAQLILVRMEAHALISYSVTTVNALCFIRVASVRFQLIHAV